MKYDMVPDFDQFAEFVLQGEPVDDIYPCIVVKCCIDPKIKELKVNKDGTVKKSEITAAGYEIKEKKEKVVKDG